MSLCNISAETDQTPSTYSIKNVGAYTILSLAFIIGVPGNIIVMWTIYRKLKTISATVLLIGNLALADFLIPLPLPIWIHTFAVDKWIFGVVFCKVFIYVTFSSLYANVFLVTLLSIERFLAVFRPFDLQRWTKQRGFKNITIFIWIAAAIVGLHSIPFYKPNESREPFQCIPHEYTSNTQKVIFFLLETFFGFLIPFCIIIICYTYLWRRLRKMRFEGKRKSDKIIVLLVVTYFISWSPWEIFKIMQIIYDFLEICSLEGIVYIAGDISGALVFINSSMNPVFYFYFASRIKSPTTIKRLNILFENIGKIETEQKPNENNGNTTARTHDDSIGTVDTDIQMA